MRTIIISAILFLSSNASAWNFANPSNGANEVSSAHSRRAVKLFSSGDMNRSFQHFEKAINEALECCAKDTIANAVFYWNLGVYYEKTNDYEKAKPFFQYAKRFVYVSN